MTNKSEFIRFRCTPADKEKIIKLAQTSNISTSEYVLRRSLGQEVHPGFIPNIKLIKNELKKWGNNINQIAKSINQGNVRGNAQLKNKTLTLLDTINKKIEKTLDNIDNYLKI